MREGILIPDMQSVRADIRFSSGDCYGRLHCGTTMDIAYTGPAAPSARNFSPTLPEGSPTPRK